MEVPQVLHAITERPGLAGPLSSPREGQTQGRRQRTGCGRKELLPLEPSSLPGREDILLSPQCLPAVVPQSQLPPSTPSSRTTQELREAPTWWKPGIRKPEGGPKRLHKSAACTLVGHAGPDGEGHVCHVVSCRAEARPRSPCPLYSVLPSLGSEGLFKPPMRWVKRQPLRGSHTWVSGAEHPQTRSLGAPGLGLGAAPPRPSAWVFPPQTG